MKLMVYLLAEGSDYRKALMMRFTITNPSEMPAETYTTGISESTMSPA
jgi:hypothetical protein